MWYIMGSREGTNSVIASSSAVDHGFKVRSRKAIKGEVQHWTHLRWNVLEKRREKGKKYLFRDKCRGI
jgi:ribosomal protein L34